MIKLVSKEKYKNNKWVKQCLTHKGYSICHSWTTAWNNECSEFTLAKWIKKASISSNIGEEVSNSSVSEHSFFWRLKKPQLLILFVNFSRQEGKRSYLSEGRGRAPTVGKLYCNRGKRDFISHAKLPYVHRRSARRIKMEPIICDIFHPCLSKGAMYQLCSWC